MDREVAIVKLKELQQIEAKHTDAAHLAADGVLCALLRSLGYDDVVDEWDKVDKWYA